MLSKAEICAGIVTFNPDIKLLLDNVKAIIPQVDKIFLFDNGSDNFSRIKNIISLSDNISVACSKKNIGIAAALNNLCSSAKQKNYSWILTMDQDSICEKSMVKNLSAYSDLDSVVAPSLPVVQPERKNAIVKIAIPYLIFFIINSLLR